MLTTAEGVQAEETLSFLESEEALTWQYYKDEKILEFYARTDIPGTGFKLDVEDTEEAKRLIGKYSLVKNNLLKTEFIPIAPFTMLEALFKEKLQNTSP